MSATLDASLFLHGIAWATGAEEPIADIPALRADEDTLGTLTSLGLERYRRSDDTPGELAHRAVVASLERAQVSPAEIDAIVYATNTFHQISFYGPDVSRLCERAGLTHAVVLGVFLAECGNTSTAFRVARGLIRSGDARCVLVVTTDTCASPAERVVPPAVTVMSDGAAACVLRAGVPSRYELVTVRQHTDATIRGAVDNSRNFVKSAKLTADGVGAVVRATLAELHLAPSDVGRFITNHYNQGVLRLFAGKSGLGLRDCYLDNLAAYAHVYAADNLINLESYGPGARPGELVLALSTGQCTWGVLAIRIHQP